METVSGIKREGGYLYESLEAFFVDHQGTMAKNKSAHSEHRTYTWPSLKVSTDPTYVQVFVSLQHERPPCQVV